LTSYEKSIVWISRTTIRLLLICSLISSNLDALDVNHWKH